MADKDTDLTFKDCSEYICVSYGDESQSRCKITGQLCDADEAGLVCTMWEEEKAEILGEEKSSLLCPKNGTFRCSHCGKELYPAKEKDKLIFSEDEQPHLLGHSKLIDTSSQSS